MCSRSSCVLAHNVLCPSTCVPFLFSLLQGMQEDVAVSMELASLYSFEIRAFKPGQQQPATSPAPQSRLSPPPASDDLLDFMGSSSPPAPAPRTAAPPAVPSTAGSGDALGLEMEFDHVGKRIRLFIDPGTTTQQPVPTSARAHHDRTCKSSLC